MERRINQLFAVSSFLQVSHISKTSTQVLSLTAFNAIRELNLEGLIDGKTRYGLEQMVYNDQYNELAEAIDDVILAAEREAQIHTEQRMAALNCAFVF